MTLFHFYASLFSFHFSEKYLSACSRQKAIQFCVTHFHFFVPHFTFTFLKILLLMLQQNIYPSAGGGNPIICDTLFLFCALLSLSLFFQQFYCSCCSRTFILQQEEEIQFCVTHFSKLWRGGLVHKHELYNKSSKSFEIF